MSDGLRLLRMATRDSSEGPRGPKAHGANFQGTRATHGEILMISPLGARLALGVVRPRSPLKIGTMNLRATADSSISLLCHTEQPQACLKKSRR